MIETPLQAPDNDSYSVYSSDEDEDIFAFIHKDKQSNEPINPGDVIEYFDPLLVKSERSRCTTVVVSVKEPPKDVTMDERDDFFSLNLSNGQLLLNSTKIRRIQVAKWEEGVMASLVNHSNGKSRKISNFVLHAKCFNEAEMQHIKDNDGSNAINIFRESKEAMVKVADQMGIPSDILR